MYRWINGRSHVSAVVWIGFNGIPICHSWWIMIITAYKCVYTKWRRQLLNSQAHNVWVWLFSCQTKIKLHPCIHAAAVMFSFPWVGSNLTVSPRVSSLHWLVTCRWWWWCYTGNWQWVIHDKSRICWLRCSSCRLPLCCWTSEDSLSV